MWALPEEQACKRDEARQPRRSSAHFLRVTPGELGHRSRATACVESLCARRRAIDDTLHDSLQNRGDTEHVVGEVKIPVAANLKAGTFAIALDVLLLVGNAQRCPV